MPGKERGERRHRDGLTFRPIAVGSGTSAVGCGGSAKGAAGSIRTKSDSPAALSTASVRRKPRRTQLSPPPANDAPSEPDGASPFRTATGQEGCAWSR
jgi:hypothetical protein